MPEPCWKWAWILNQPSYISTCFRKPTQLLEIREHCTVMFQYCIAILFAKQYILLWNTNFITTLENMQVCHAASRWLLQFSLVLWLSPVEPELQHSWSSLTEQWKNSWRAAVTGWDIAMWTVHSVICLLTMSSCRASLHFWDSEFKPWNEQIIASRWWG